MAKLVHYASNLQIPHQQRVVKADDYQAYIVVSDAQKTAQTIIAEATQAGEQIKNQAYQQGLEQGLQQADEQITHKILQLTQGYADYIENVENQLPATLLSLIQRVFSDYSDAEKLAGLVNQTLRKLKQEKRVFIRVCPADHTDFVERLNAMLNDKALDMQVEVEMDTELLVGQCHVEFEQGLYILEVDSLMEQFDELLQVTSESP